MKHEILVQLALECGATKATIISQSQIVTSAAFRDICANNGCGLYGKCWMCPPDVGDITALMAKLKEFSHGLLYQTIGTLEDSFDFEGMTEAGNRHALVSQKLQEMAGHLLPPNPLHLTCGGCRLCERCAKLDGQPCRMPQKALPSLEGYGVDVYQTVKDTELKYVNGSDTVTFFGMILFQEDSYG